MWQNARQMCEGVSLRTTMWNLQRPALLAATLKHLNGFLNLNGVLGFIKNLIKNLQKVELDISRIVR